MIQDHKRLSTLAALSSLLAALVLAVPHEGGARVELVLQDHKLLARYAPVVVLHPAERSAPTNVEGFLADAELSGTRYDVRACSARDGLAALDCYGEADEPAPAVAYGAAFRSGGRTALQYWLFHAFDLYEVPVLDHVGRGRRVAPTVVRVSARSPAWMRFAGSFGESQYMHFPQATFAFGSGPRGPAFHDLWRRPFAEPRTWPLERRR